LVDAGYAADENATAGSVVRRDPVNGRILVTTNTIGFPAITAQSLSLYGVESRSINGTGGFSQSQNGQHHHAFGQVSAIARTTGALSFLGASADANRLAQTNEIQAVSFGAAQALDPIQQAQARTNINAETAGEAATVQGNLNAHTGDASIHFTQSAISITPTQAGADPAGSAAGVQTNLTTHVSNTANPHNVTAAQVGAVAKAGDTMTGTLNLQTNGLVVGKCGDRNEQSGSGSFNLAAGGGPT
jgi:hypothetical protein